MRNSAKRNAGRCLSRLRTFMLLAASMLPALSQAQTVNICDRTPQVRDEIMLAIGASDCAAVTAAQLTGINQLCFSSHRLCPGYARNPILALKAGDFNRLTGLANLNLRRNHLITLPEGVFDELTNLGMLSLSENSLARLPYGVFDRLTNLGILELNSNRLHTLPAGVFDNLRNLHRLALAYNHLFELPPGIFDNLNSPVFSLYLMGNSLRLTGRNDRASSRLHSSARVRGLERQAGDDSAGFVNLSYSIGALGRRLDRRIDELQNSLDALRAALEGRIGELQAALDDSTVTSEEKAADLEERLTALEAAIEDIGPSRVLYIPVPMNEGD